MYTYQDLVAIGQEDNERMKFVLSAIGMHKRTDLYETAKVAYEYFCHRNVTITEYQKILYTVTGQAVPDNWSANFKMACRHFHRFVTQETQFLLGNGVDWENAATADKLGNQKYPFDNQLQEAAKNALIMGVSFGLFNFDHVDVFSLLEFVPLYDEENGSLSAGIRFWQVDDSKPLRATLYELDGYTDFIWRYGEANRVGVAYREGEVLTPKRPYKLKVRQSAADGEEIYDGENYPGFPIVPLWGNSEHQSELVGLREQIDCYDLIKSGFANTVDEASIVYWTLQNAGGMDDVDLTKFVERMKTMHAAVVDDDGARAESHVIEAPFASREALLNRLDRDLYRDAMALDTDMIAGGAVTATQIRAAYEPLNSKVDDFEYCVEDFVNGILALAGVEDGASFTRSMVVNVEESMSMILQAAQYLPSAYVTEKILTLLGDGDKTEEILDKMDEENLERMSAFLASQGGAVGGDEANGSVAGGGEPSEEENDQPA